LHGSTNKDENVRKDAWPINAMVYDIYGLSE